MDRENLRGVRVLIHGASGALGLLALQILSSAGAQITAIGGESGRQAMVNAGASRVIDRTEIPWQMLRGEFDASLNFAHWPDELNVLGCLRTGASGHATTVHPLLHSTDAYGLPRGLWRSRQEHQRMRSELPRGCQRYAWTVFSPDIRALQNLSAWMNPAVPRKLHLPLALIASMDRPAAGFEHVAAGRAGRAVLMPPAFAAARLPSN